MFLLSFFVSGNEFFFFNVLISFKLCYSVLLLLWWTPWPKATCGGKGLFWLTGHSLSLRRWRQQCKQELKQRPWGMRLTVLLTGQVRLLLLCNDSGPPARGWCPPPSVWQPWKCPRDRPTGKPDGGKFAVKDPLLKYVRLTTKISHHNLFQLITFKTNEYSTFNIYWYELHSRQSGSRESD